MTFSGLFTTVAGLVFIAIIVGVIPTANRWVAIIPLMFLILGAAAFAFVSNDRPIVRNESV